MSKTPFFLVYLDEWKSEILIIIAFFTTEYYSHPRLLHLKCCTSVCNRVPNDIRSSDHQAISGCCRMLAWVIRRIKLGNHSYDIDFELSVLQPLKESKDNLFAVFSPRPCRGLVNDTYKMDLILVHPPHLIALACIYIASVQKDKENTAWFEELRVDMNVVSHLF